jgi:octaprenyl-diphosphate synthase
MVEKYSGQQLLESIKAPVIREFGEFKTRYQEMMHSPVPSINEVLQYVGKQKGKQLRPLILLLCAKSSGKITDATYLAAILVELLHTATLIHDDVVDDSDQRRGIASVRAIWKNKTAVLVGDYLLSRCILFPVRQHQYTFIRVISQCIKKIIEGEILQLKSLKNTDISEDLYLKIIRNKTAALISACCKMGATSVSAEALVYRNLSHFGTSLGITFQIRDDLFPFSGNGRSGKPPELDILEGNITLPLIFALQKAPGPKTRKLKRIITKNGKDLSDLKRIVDFAHFYGGVDYARRLMSRYAGTALENLHVLADSESRQALINLTEYFINRNR